MRKQRGFTLIELAIVLVIIGLLLGGVLKGQELINSAKVKNMGAEITSVASAIYAYQDRFKAIPGDDAGAAAHVGGAVGTNGTAGDGTIQGAWDSTTVTHESALVWQHLRAAGLLQGSTDTAVAASYFPTNAMAGRLGVQSVNGFTKITGMTGSFAVCSDLIPGKFVKQLDIALDDGETGTGALRAVLSTTATGAGVATSAIVEASQYTVCMTF